MRHACSAVNKGYLCLFLAFGFCKAHVYAPESQSVFDRSGRDGVSGVLQKFSHKYSGGTVQVAAQKFRYSSGINLQF